MSSNKQKYSPMIMQYLEVKEKYPKFFETEHDVVTLKYSIARIKVEEKLFNEGMEQYKNLGYMDSKYLIRVPDKPEELKFEGQKLNHCVGSYGSRVASGQCGVVFLRRKEQEDEPYITIEVIKDRIVQMQGAGRRQPNTEEMNFISKWAYKKQLRIAV